MKVNFFKGLWVLTILLGGVAAQAGQHPIGFTVAGGYVPGFNADPNSNVYLANEAFQAKYGVEQGLVGTTVGNTGELLVLVSAQRFAREIWRKMLGAGDAFSAQGGRGYIRFEDAYPEPSVQYTYFGKANIQEGTSYTYPVLNGTPAIRGFMVAMEEKCGMGKSGVQALTPVVPTKLIKSKRLGSYTIGYEYSVNGGNGALVSGITVSVARRHFGPFIVDICPVDVYVLY